VTGDGFLVLTDASFEDEAASSGVDRSTLYPATTSFS